MCAETSFSLNDVTAVVPVWRHPDLAYRAVHSLRRFYPRLSIIVVDDGSPQEEFERLRQIPARLLRHEKNRNHGAALDTGLADLGPGFNLMLSCDYDVVLWKPGVIEFLLDMMEDNVIAAGWWRNNKTSKLTGLPFVHPMLALWRKDIIEYEHLSFMRVSFPKWEFATAQMLCSVAQTRGYEIKGVSEGTLEQYLHHFQWRPLLRQKMLRLKKMRR